MKKIIKVLLLITSISILLVGCNKKEKVNNEEVKNENVTDSQSENKKYVIGINQHMEHKALDDAKEGFIDGLKELGIDAEIIDKNAQGEISNSTTIAQKFASDKVDLIYAIATPAAQNSATATQDIPILFTAVTDAEGANLVKSNENPGGNVTGTSDAADIKSQLEMFKEIDPSIETIGIIYNLSEQNSVVQVNIVESLVDELSLKLKTVGIDNINDMPQGIQTLIKDSDAVYIVSDNMVAKSIDLLSSELIKNNKISISGEESQVHGGALLTNGLKYYDLGKITAEMAKEILVDGKNPSDMAVRYAVDKTILVNTKTMEALGIDKDHPLLKDAEFTE